MKSVPHTCPVCKTKADSPAYSRLVFGDEPNPTCVLCGGPILPTHPRFWAVIRDLAK